MSRKTVLSRIAAGALALGMVAGLAAAAQAQTLTCKYVTGQADPLVIQVPKDVTDEFEVLVSPIETNRNATRLTKASGLAFVDFPENLEIDAGLFVAEVDAKLKDMQDAELSCVDKARVRGAGELLPSDPEELSSWVIRSNSRLDARTRASTLGDCDGVLSVGGPCSVHAVNARLMITAQGQRNNGSLKYRRFSLNQKDIFEAVEGDPATQGEGVVLLCSCIGAIAPEPADPLVEE